MPAQVDDDLRNEVREECGQAACAPSLPCVRCVRECAGCCAALCLLDVCGLSAISCVRTSTSAYATSQSFGTLCLLVAAAVNPRIASPAPPPGHAPQHKLRVHLSSGKFGEVRRVKVEVGGNAADTGPSQPQPQEPVWRCTRKNRCFNASQTDADLGRGFETGPCLLWARQGPFLVAARLSCT